MVVCILHHQLHPFDYELVGSALQKSIADGLELVRDGGMGPVEEMVDGGGGDGTRPCYDHVGAAAGGAPDLRDHNAREDAGMVGNCARAEVPGSEGGTL